MHQFAFIFLSLLVFGSSSSFAQKRVEVGVFIDYLSISETSTNNFGVGGHFGYRIHRIAMMEGKRPTTTASTSTKLSAILRPET